MESHSTSYTGRIFAPTDEKDLGVRVAYRIFKKASRNWVFKFWNWDSVLPGISLLESLSFLLILYVRLTFSCEDELSLGGQERWQPVAPGVYCPSLASQVHSASALCNSKEVFWVALLLVTHLPWAQGLRTGTSLRWPYGCVACSMARPEQHGMKRGALDKKGIKVTWGKIEI